MTPEDVTQPYMPTVESRPWPQQSAPTLPPQSRYGGRVGRGVVSGRHWGFSSGLSSQGC